MENNLTLKDLPPKEIAFLPNEDNLLKLIKSGLAVWDGVTGISLSGAQGTASDFFRKNMLGSISIRNIISSKPNNDFLPYLPSDAVINDFPSANSLLRALFECYINMSYLFKDGLEGDLFNLKFALWKRHSLIEIKKMTRSSGFKGVGSFTDAEEEKIKILEAEITKSEYFNSLPWGTKCKIMEKDEWSLEDTYKKAEHAGISRSRAEFLYKYLSGYAHSTTFAIEQISTIQSGDIAKDMMSNAIYHTDMILSKTLELFGKIVPEADGLIKIDTYLTGRIKLWNEEAKKDLKEINAKFNT